MKTIRIGTRGSLLARRQTGMVAEALSQAAGAGVHFETAVIKTTGDLAPEQPLTAALGKGLFTKELEDALLKGEIDLAVHSMKDMPASLPAGLKLAASPKREDPRDALLFAHGETGNLDSLPQGALIGSGSPRRCAFLKAARSDLKFLPLRGNVDTRLRKLDEGQVQALVLAVAGLKRLGRAERIGMPLDPQIFVPQAGQGALAIEIREADEALTHLVEEICDLRTNHEMRAERAFLQRVDMGCQAPLGCLARLGVDKLTVTARVCQPERDLDQTEMLEGGPEEAEEIGLRLGDKILKLLSK